MPLLSEVFKAFPDVSINIDLKEGADGLIEEVNRLIVAHEREDRTVWGSFKQEVTTKCYKQASCTLFALFEITPVIFFFFIFIRIHQWVCFSLCLASLSCTFVSTRVFCPLFRSKRLIWRFLQ